MNNLSKNVNDAADQASIDAKLAEERADEKSSDWGHEKESRTRCACYKRESNGSIKHR